MKKLLTYFILIFLSFNINAEISRNSIDNIKQLSWSEIVDAVSETYQYGYVSAVNIDGLYFHPVEARYGKLSQKIWVNIKREYQHLNMVVSQLKNRVETIYFGLLIKKIIKFVMAVNIQNMIVFIFSKV